MPTRPLPIASERASSYSVKEAAAMNKHYLVASDFDQTLSFNDSGVVLSEVVGVPGFREKAADLSRLNLVQQGAELAYLLAHDPLYRSEERRVGKECRSR